MAKTRLVKNSKGQYGIYDPYQDQVTPITSDMTLVKNTRGKYGFKKGNEIIDLGEVPSSMNIEETFKKKVDTESSSATSSTDSTSDFYKTVSAKPTITEEDPKKQLAAKDQAKQQENQRYIDVFGLGRLDYSGLQKFGSLGEIAADALDVPANLSKAFVRGVSSGRVNQAILDYAKEGGNLDSDMIARLVKENAAKTGSVYLDTLQKKGILQTDDMSAAGGIAEVILESLGSMAGAYKAGFQGAVAGGSAGMFTGAAAGAIGGPVGSVVAGAVSTTGGAVAGFTGMTSYANEYGASIIQALTKKGYDLTNAKQVEAALKDKSVMDDAKEIANQRGLIIGGIDAMTAGIAGKGAQLAVKIAKRSAIQAGKEITKAGIRRVAAAAALGIEASGGSIGEAAAQLNAEGKITDMDAIALEGIAEIGNAGPTGLYAAYKAGQINSDLNQDNLTKIEELKKAKEALPDENQATKKALDNKISSLEKENKERNKSMTSALQVTPVPATKRVIELTDAITDIESTLEAIKDGTRTDISQEARKAMWDSMNDMIAERDEIRQEMLKANENEAAINMAPEKPMKPVIFIGENKEKVDNNNATVMSPNKPLETVKVDEPITFAEKISDEKNAKPGVAYNVSQGNHIFGTIVESDNNGEKQFILAETGKKYASLDDAKFALQEKLTGQRVSEKERTGINRVKVEGNLANQKILIGDPANNNQLGLESKGAIQRAVRAMRSVSNANVYLYSNTEDYEKGIAHASGGDTKAVTGGTNAQVVDANGENSIHINLEKADGTTISHEVFHGALLGLAKKDPNAFVTMRDKILDRISEKQNLSVTDETGNKRKVSAKEYLMDFQKRYEGSQYTEADRAEEFLSELAGLMSLEDNSVVKDKSLLDSIKLTIKDVLKKFNVEFDSLNELQDSEDLVQFFKEFNRSVKTGEAINLSRVEGIQGTAQAAAQPTAQATPIAEQVNYTPIHSEEGTRDFFEYRRDVRLKDKVGTDEYFATTNVDESGSKTTTFAMQNKEEGDTSLSEEALTFYERTKKYPEGYQAPKSGLTVDSIKDFYGKSIEELLDTYLKEGKIPSAPAIYDPSSKVMSVKLYSENVENKNGKEQKSITVEVFFTNDKNGPEFGGYYTLPVPKLKYTGNVAIQPVAQPATQPTAKAEPKIRPAKFRVTKSGGKIYEPTTVLKVKVEKDGKLVDQNIVAKAKMDKNGKVTTNFETQFVSKYYEDNRFRYNGIFYNSEQSAKENAGNTGRNGEGFKSIDDFESDYGISLDDLIREHGINIKDNQYIHHFALSAEEIQTHVKGEGPIYYIKGHLGIRKIGSKPNTKDLTSDGVYIGTFVPKLKYTDAITGISTAQPEAGAVKESATTRPEGAKKKESTAKVISAATDKAKPSVKVKAEPAPGKATVGNTKKISERVAKVTGAIFQASQIEPTNAREMALQYFINGGTVLRGNTSKGAKPTPHSLVTLFTKSRAGVYFSDNSEMEARLQLYRNGRLTLSEVAHKLWESSANQSLQLDAQELEGALNDVIMDHKSSASMAKEMLDTRGSATQRALISGNNKIAGMDEYELWTHEQVAKIFGVSVEEVIDNPEKFVNQETLDGMYDDMLSAFEILDKIQDEDAIKQYLEISAPEDLFLDELVAEVAKPEKTLQEKKADLEKQIKAKKKELAAANKAKKEMGGIGQTSLVGGVQTTIVAPDTMALYGKIRNLKGEIEDLNSQLGKVESAIEFKERKTIDAFADVVEQKAEESAPPIAPANEEDKQQWLIEQDAEYALRDKEDLELMKLSSKVYRAQNEIAGAKNAEDAIKNYNEVKAKRDDYEASINKRRQEKQDAEDLQTLIDDEINDSQNPRYLYAEDFKKSPLLAAYKHALDVLEYVSSSDYIDYQVKNGYQTKEQAIKDQKNSIANFERYVFLTENAIVKESMAEQAAKAEENNNTLGNEARLAMSKEIDNQLAAKENQLIEKQNQDIEKAKGDIAAIKNGDKSVIDEYVKKSGYQLITKKVIASNPNSKILRENEGSYYKNLGYQIKVGTAQQIALQGATNKARSKATGGKTTNQYQDAYNAISKLSKGEITPEEARSIIENSGLAAPKAIMAKAEPAKAELSKNEKEIKSLEAEIEQYEREIEDATEEIENTKYNYREAVDEIKAEKKELAASSLDKEAKADHREELDARLEDAADERDTYIEQYKDAIAEAKKEIKALQKKIDKLKTITKSQISGERVSVNKETVSGKSVWNHIVSITPDEEDVPTGLKKDIVDRKFYVEDKFDLASLLNTDPDFKDYYDTTIKDESFRYDQEEVDPNDLYNTIVVVDGELRDGYSRATNLLYQGEETAEAFVATPKVTTKSQISGARVTPFEKADPTYKYQMSGTEASLKLIDNIRSKYKMQNTAEEMGMVSKGIRATEKVVSDNVVTRALGRVFAVTYKGLANEKANKFLGKPLAVAQKFLSENVRKGLSSQNAAAANASAITVGLIQSLGSTEDFQFARNKLNGGKSVAKNELWQLGKCLNDMINQDKLALRRVHSLLDPEAFEGITDPSLPDSKDDLSFAELRLFNSLRDMNDYIHEWHYQNGFLGEGAQADALYQKNKGSYFARMYKEIEDEKFGQLYDALSALPNSADFTMFKERKDFTDVKNKFTLKEDPIYITTKRFGQMMQNQAILQFCDYVAKSGDYQIYDNKEDIPAGALKAGNYRRMPYGKNGGKAYGELTGKLVPDIVAQQLIGVEFSNEIINLTYQAAKVFDKTFARQVLSKLKTTWNPLTRAGNITMNFVFASLAGVDPLTLLKNRPSAKESLDTYDSYARDLDANGLLGVSMGKELNNEKDTEARRILSEKLDRNAPKNLRFKRKPTVDTKDTPVVPQNKLGILGSGTKKVVSDLDQMLTDSYGKSDDVAKVALYKSLVDDYGKTREEAIKIVASSMQNYNTVGKAYDYASKSVNRFVKFKADSARILFNTFKDRPLNLMATLGMYLAAQALASKMSGEDEEERKIREQRPYTNKIKIGPVTISLTMKFGNTEVNVARYLAPYSMYDAGYNNNTLKEITTMLPLQYDENTFISVNDPLIGPVINLINDKDFRGMPISDPGKTPFVNKTVTDNEAFWNRVAFAARNYSAPYYGWYENIMAAATGDKDYYGRSRTLSDALLNTVIKVQKVDNESLQRTYEGALRKLDREVDNAGKTISHNRREMNKAIEDKASDENVTQEQLEKFRAKEESKFLDFKLEQLDYIEKQRIEMERVRSVKSKLQDIQQRKQQ